MKYNLANYSEQYFSSGEPYGKYGIAAGGVVYKYLADQLQILLLTRHDKQISYHLPKGTVYVGESLESAALREIAEECGVRTELKTYIGAKTEKFTYMNKYFDKTTHYYVAEYVADEQKMDNEHDGKVWVDANEAVSLLKPNINHEDIFVERAIKFLTV